jgi:hypothetical protein
MSALLVFHKHRNAAGQFLENEQALLGIANSEELLHHVICILMGDQLAEIMGKRSQDVIELIIGHFSKKGLKISRLPTVFDVFAEFF